MIVLDDLVGCRRAGDWIVQAGGSGPKPVCGALVLCVNGLWAFWCPPPYGWVVVAERGLTGKWVGVQDVGSPAAAWKDTL